MVPGGRRRARAWQQRQLTASLTGIPIGGVVVHPAAAADWRSVTEHRLQTALEHLAAPDREPRILIGLEYLDDADDDRATVWVATRAQWRAGMLTTVLDRLAATPAERMQLVITTEVAVTAYVAEQIVSSESPGRG
jgi:hypothetical protein